MNDKKDHKGIYCKWSGCKLLQHYLLQQVKTLIFHMYSGLDLLVQFSSLIDKKRVNVLCVCLIYWVLRHTDIIYFKQTYPMRICNFHIFFMFIASEGSSLFLILSEWSSPYITFHFISRFDWMF
jgi:hypothetical protein